MLSKAAVASLCADAMRAWDAQKAAAAAETEAAGHATWLQASLLVDVHHHSAAVREYYWRG